MVEGALSECPNVNPCPSSASGGAVTQRHLTSSSRALPNIKFSEYSRKSSTVSTRSGSHVDTTSIRNASNATLHKTRGESHRHQCGARTSSSRCPRQQQKEEGSSMGTYRRSSRNCRSNLARPIRICRTHQEKRSPQHPSHGSASPSQHATHTVTKRGIVAHQQGARARLVVVAQPRHVSSRFAGGPHQGRRSPSATRTSFGGNAGMLFFDICFSSSLRSSSNSLYRRFTVQVMSPVSETGGRVTGTGALQVTPRSLPTRRHRPRTRTCATGRDARSPTSAAGAGSPRAGTTTQTQTPCTQPPSPRATCTSKDTNFRSMTSTDGM